MHVAMRLLQTRAKVVSAPLGRILWSIICNVQVRLGFVARPDLSPHVPMAAKLPWRVTLCGADAWSLQSFLTHVLPFAAPTALLHVDVRQSAAAAGL